MLWQPGSGTPEFPCPPHPSGIGRVVPTADVNAALPRAPAALKSKIEVGILAALPYHRRTAFCGPVHGLFPCAVPTCLFTIQNLLRTGPAMRGGILWRRSKPRIPANLQP